MKDMDDVRLHFRSARCSGLGRWFSLHSLKVHHYLIKILRKGMRVAKLALKGDNLKQNKSELSRSSSYLLQASQRGVYKAVVEGSSSRPPGTRGQEARGRPPGSDQFLHPSTCSRALP